MDCQMPIMNGYDACLQIRKFLREKETDQPYIIACTGNVEDTQVKQAFDSEFDEVMAKPVWVDLVCEVLAQTLELESH